MYLSDIKRDDRFEGYLIVRSAEQRASANGKNYLDMTLADISGSINAKMWDGTVQPPLAGMTCHRWLAPEVTDHWCTQVPLATPPMARSMTLPVKRFLMRYSLSPASTKNHCCQGWPS